MRNYNSKEKEKQQLMGNHNKQTKITLISEVKKISSLVAVQTRSLGTAWFSKYIGARLSGKGRFLDVCFQESSFNLVRMWPKGYDGAACDCGSSGNVAGSQQAGSTFSCPHSLGHAYCGGCGKARSAASATCVIYQGGSDSSESLTRGSERRGRIEQK